MKMFGGVGGNRP